MKDFDFFSYVKPARKHYQDLGYSNLETPWVVSSKALNITRPLVSNSSHNSSSLVASGEQSFLQMILEDKLELAKFQTFTPCFRPFDTLSDIHCQQFYKLELIDYFGDEAPKQEDLFEMVNHALEFFHSYEIGCLADPTIDEPRECDTIYSVDISGFIGKDPIELGSYGIRFHKSIGYWIYGTGVAFPRFNYVLKGSKNERQRQ